MPSPSDGCREDDPSSASPLTQRLIGELEEQFGPLGSVEQIDELVDRLAEEDEQLSQTERASLAELTALLDAVTNPSDAPDVSARVTVTVSEDQMHAMIAVDPPIGNADPPTRAEVIDALREAGVMQGVMARVIQAALKRVAAGESVRDHLVAQGRPATDGSDGSAVLYGRVSSRGDLEPVPTPDGPDDAATDRKRWLCREGDRIAELTPASPGQAGVTVTGDPLPPDPGKPPPLAFGDNIQLDGDQAIARTTGVIETDGRRVRVRRALVVPHDLTAHDEPIDFDGDIIVEGRVGSRASITATGTLHIAGQVEDATLISSEGDVILDAGVACQGRGHVTAGRDFVCKFAERATIVAGRDITLTTGGMHCDFTAGRDIVCKTGKGTLAGGHLIAGRRLIARRLGTAAAGTTHVRVGVRARDLRKLNDFAQMAAAARHRLDQIEHGLERLTHAVGSPEQLGPRERGVYVKLAKLRFICLAQLRKVDQRRRDALAESVAHEHACVRVQDGLAGQVQIAIGDLTHDCKARSTGAEYRLGSEGRQIDARALGAASHRKA
jgi:uncharacterized protein (DUF342 family)